ncbi:MAG: hypothetical protein QF437_13895, partial [Planctomycetota bacterium]|nr:hypothetical protein [Planctomycetota bacterium]
MLNTREVLFLKTAGNLKLLDQTQLTQAQEGIKQARAQSNPIFVWDLLVHWQFLPKEKAEYVVKLILQAEKKQTGASSTASLPAAQPAAPAAQAVPGSPAAMPAAQPAAPAAQAVPGSPAAPAAQASPGSSAAMPAVQAAAAQPIAPAAQPAAPGAQPAAPAVPGAQAQMPAAVAQMPAAPQIPSAAPAVPAAQPLIPGAAPGVPAAEPQLPGVAPGVPGAQPQMPGVAPGVPGAQPQMPGAAPGVPGAQPPDSAAAPAEVATAADTAESVSAKAKGPVPVGLIAAGIVLVIAVGGGLAFYFLKPPADPVTPEDGGAIAAGNTDETGNNADKVAVNPGGPPPVTPGGPPSVTPGGPPTVNPGGPPTVNPGGPPTVNPGGPPTVNPGGPPVGIPGGPPKVEPGGPPKGNPGVAPIGLAPNGPGGALSQAQVNKANAELKVLSSQVAELVTNKNYDQALLKLNAYKLNTSGDPVLKAKVDSLIAEVNQEKNPPPVPEEEEEPELSLPVAGGQGSGSKQVTKEIDTYTNIRQQIDPLLKEKKFGEAKGILGKLVEKPENELYYNFLNQLQGDLTKADEFIVATHGLLKEKVGSDIHWGGLPSKVKSVDDEKMVIEAIGREKTVPLCKIKVTEHMKVQGINSKDANTDQLFAMGLVYFCDGQYSQARKLLDETKLTHNSESYLEFMNKDNDSKALEIVREIQTAQKAKDLKALSSLTKKLRESHEQSPVTSAYNNLLIQADEDLAKYRDERKKQIDALLALSEKVQVKIRSEISKKNGEIMKKIAEIEKKPQRDNFSYKLIGPKKGPKSIRINNQNKTLREIQKEGVAKEKFANLADLQKYLCDHVKKT